MEVHSTEKAIEAIEVRPGLFCLKWTLPDDMEEVVIYKAKSQLCGSQSNHVFNLTYSLTSQTFDPQKKYCIVIKVEKSSSITDFCVNDTSVENPTPQTKQQQLPESKTSDSQLDPLYMWCYWGPYSTFCFEQINLVDWSLSLEQNSMDEEVVLWMDFGTSTVAKNKILNGLAEMFNNQTNCDVYFNFKDLQNIGAHANILSAGSPVFAAMFQSSYLESKSRKVVIDDIDPRVFKQLLIFLYTGKAPRLTEKKITQPLYEVADKYGVEILKNDCVKVLKKKLSTGNAIDVLVWSQFFSIPNLFETAMQFVVNHSRELCSQPQWMNFMKDHPELCLQANQRMAALLPPSKKRAV